MEIDVEVNLDNIDKEEMFDLLSDMHYMVGTMPCECVPTEEEHDYQERLSAVEGGPEAKLLWMVLTDMPETSVEFECIRCGLLGRYQDLIGFEAFDDEWEATNSPLTDEQKDQIAAHLAQVIIKRALEERGETS